VSNIVEEIKKPINEEMKLFEQKFYESMQSRVPLLDKVTRFIVTTKGKQMRPMFVFLTAQLVGNNQPDALPIRHRRDQDPMNFIGNNL
jgi:octaprenyl-diphosphate synthase